MPPLAQFHPDLAKRGFLSFVFDGRYKFARYYAPSQFNPPTTLDRSGVTMTSNCLTCKMTY
jgi:hypothetical protein